MTELIFPVIFQKIVQANQYTVFILAAKEKKFAVYTTSTVGDFVQGLFTDKPSVRPQTLDLVGSICNGLEIIPLQLIIHDISEAIYFCKLFLTQPSANDQKILEIDTRPSDGLAIALMYNLPIYCTQNLLDKTLDYQD